VRHASALYAAGYEAARALVVAALGDDAPSRELHLVESTIAYKRVGLGPLTFTAEPAGAEWESPAASVDGGTPASLATNVVGLDEDGKEVVSLSLLWSVRPAG
jgi:hypothetical protein